MSDWNARGRLVRSAACIRRINPAMTPLEAIRWAKELERRLAPYRTKVTWKTLLTELD